ncbi:MAG: potassium transporter, partial [Alistipes sp.]|nr:potassium transporter [Alistipes sp.]
ITDKSVKRAYATIFGSVMFIIVCFVTLVVVEPKIDAFDLLFETISALSTAGASLGITPLLSTTSKILFSVLMFVGRVGLITVAMSLFASREHRHYQLPEENVIIN